VPAFLFLHHHTKEVKLVIGREEDKELRFQIALAKRSVLMGNSSANIVLLSLLRIREALTDEWVPVNTAFFIDQTADPV